MPHALRRRPRRHPLPVHPCRPIVSPLPRPRQPLLHWPALSAATACAALLVACCLAWVARHPRPRATVYAPTPVIQVERPDMTQPAVKPASAPTPALTVIRREEEPVRPPATEEPPRRLARQSYGTALSFVDDPAEAARQAGAEDRVLFLLHVSGNFEESCFT